MLGGVASEEVGRNVDRKRKSGATVVRSRKWAPGVHESRVAPAPPFAGKPLFKASSSPAEPLRDTPPAPSLCVASGGTPASVSARDGHQGALASEEASASTALALRNLLPGMCCTRPSSIGADFGGKPARGAGFPASRHLPAAVAAIIMCPSTAKGGDPKGARARRGYGGLRIGPVMEDGEDTRLVAQVTARNEGRPGSWHAGQLCQTRANLVEISQIQSISARIRPKWDRMRSSSDQLQLGIGRNWPKLDRVRPNFTRHRPKLAGSRSHLATKFGPVSANFD